MQAALSSRMTDFPSELRHLVGPLHSEREPSVGTYISEMFSINRRSGMRARAHWLSAIYSASHVLKAISVCNLECQIIGTPLYIITKPVLLNEELRVFEFALHQVPAKSASHIAWRE
jgi:hypothetical protein